MRFRPEQHLRRQSDIRAAREQGSKLNCQSYVLWHRQKAESSALPRLGVVASAAAVGGAIQRNRAKRRLREVFRRHQQLVPKGCDLLLIARSGVTQRPFPELERKFVEACRILSQAGVSEDRHG